MNSNHNTPIRDTQIDKDALIRELVGMLEHIEEETRPSGSMAD